MSQPFLGEIRIFGFNFAPRGWSMCDGSTLPISQHDALFSLIGTTYGGDGESTFNLPNLQGRVPFGTGQGGGQDELSVSPGAQGGVTEVTLTLEQIPPHVHQVTGRNAPRTSSTPDGSALVPGDIYAPQDNWDGELGLSVGSAGGGQPHSNVQPYLALTFCIALEGIYPPNGQAA